MLKGKSSEFDREELYINLFKDDSDFRTFVIFYFLLIFVIGIAIFQFALNFRDFLDSVNNGHLSFFGVICWFLCPLINILLFPISFVFIVFSIYYLVKPRFVFLSEEYLEFKISVFRKIKRIYLSEIVTIECNRDLVKFKLTLREIIKVNTSRISIENIVRVKKALESKLLKIHFLVEKEVHNDLFKSIVRNED
jgi:hypothetical protein